MEAQDPSLSPPSLTLSPPLSHKRNESFFTSCSPFPSGRCLRERVILSPFLTSLRGRLPFLASRPPLSFRKKGKIVLSQSFQRTPLRMFYRFCRKSEIFSFFLCVGDILLAIPQITLVNTVKIFPLTFPLCQRRQSLCCREERRPLFPLERAFNPPDPSFLAARALELCAGIHPLFS